MSRSLASYEGVDEEEQFRVASAAFTRLAEDTRLPFLEVQLIRKYFIERKDTRSIRTIDRINVVLGEHRRQTLRILGMCQTRDTLVEDLMATVKQFKARGLTTLQFQTSALHLLYQHRQITLTIVEEVFAWREGLTRPFPFTFKGGNYFTKILADCKTIDGAGIEQVLPLKMSEFPLCSNVQAISLFADADRSPTKNNSSLSPERRAKRDVAIQERLRTAEIILLNEVSMQQRVFAELKDISEDGKFVTLLNIPDIIPDCAEGIPVSNKKWDGMMRESVARAQQKADADAAAHPQLS